MNSPQTKFRNLLPAKFYWLLCFAVFITACSSSDGGDEIVKSNAKQITSFSLPSVSNSSLNQDITGSINQDTRTISLVVPFGIDVTALIPNITISQGAQISPTIDGAIDFSSPVVFTVTAEDESIVDYTINVSNAANTEKRIIQFTFTTALNPSLSEEITGNINENDRTISASVPFSAEITALVPSFIISDNATSDPTTETAVDFTSSIDFEITAQDGSAVNYAITITKNESDFDTLKAFSDANPGNNLTWDFDNLDISTWPGVTAENGRVTALTLSNKGLTVIPASIGDLPMLNLLYLQDNDIASIPAEIGNLSSSLTQLLLSNNPIKTLPPEIGDLINLEFLDLFGASLESLPIEIGNLSNLVSLNLSRNFFLTALPSQIGNLSSLTRLSLSGANHPIPVEIGNLSNLTFLNLNGGELTAFPTQVLGLTNLSELYLSGNTNITTVPSGIGNLINLTKLFLNSNALVSLPVEISELVNLTDLNISGNPTLTSIPQEICDMESNGTTITKDAATTCI